MSEKTRIQKAIHKEAVDRPPIWFMRQAGRYLPEYMKLKGERDFMACVKDSDTAAEITLQPIERFNLDAAIIFSDILVILEALNLNVSFATGAPEIGVTLKDEADLSGRIANYSKDEMLGNLDYYTATIQKTRARLAPEKSLLGFAAAPFTLASYMIEGKTSKTHAKSRAWMYGTPEVFEKLMDYIAKITIDYLELQIEAGVDAIQLFDSWGDAMDSESYQKYILPHIAKISREISKKVPVIFFCRGASIHRDVLKPMYSEGVSVISLDWRMPIDAMGDGAVQGNMDPAYLLSNPNAVKNKVSSLLNTRGKDPGYIFNLGHGIYPETPMENVEAMVQTVQEFRI